MRQNDTKKTTSVFTVVIWLIIFWPVGLYFLFKKSAQDKGKEVVPGLGLRVMGWIVMVFGVLLYIGLSSVEPKDTGAGTFFIVIALTFLAIGYVKKRDYNVQIKNTSQINNTNTSQNINPNSFSRSYSTQQVNATVVDPNKTVNIKGGDLLYRNKNTGEIYTNIDKVQNIFGNAMYTGATQEKPNINEPEEKVVTCKSCGANNKVSRGQVKECEFCGTLLQ